ncbi:serine/threonine-protein kinase VRK1-like isoform X2 [Oratosquilla oratoria]|uniref:serine/threonine-protein kinase VRK1-like isoform X2 n=1 Tax=Oratosquilla oratoria TaxID=337810 RepID=UPI003F772128
MAPKRGTGNKSSGAPKKRIAANGYKLPDPIAAGQILTDMSKRQWRLGRSIGTGGFGEIYLASDDLTQDVSDNADYVIKIEPHSNGPLFAEMHCYMRIAKPDLIEAWKREKKLKQLGMPKYFGSGSHEYKGNKYRFMVMERFGLDLQKILERHNKRLSFKTVYHVGIQILDALEYIHSKEYIHADIKASNLLVGHQPGTENQVYLVDYGLACRYANDGLHKEYKYDQRKAHDGTIEFTSRDAHIGAHSRRGDLEILGYNLVQWLCAQLPWEDNLQNCNYVAKQKRGYMDNIDTFIQRCFSEYEPPGLKDYLEYVVNLAFDEKPDYEKCRNILREGLKSRGYKGPLGKLEFLAATPAPVSRKGRSRMEGRKRGTKRRSDEAENIAELNPKKQMRVAPSTPCRQNNCNRVNTRLYPRTSMLGISLSKSSQPEFFVESEEALIEKENQKIAARKQRERPKRLQIKKDTSLDNPTPQMLAIMAKIREKASSPPICNKRHRHNSCRSSPTYDEAPSQFTPEMEAVMRRRIERLSSSDSEGYSSSSSASSAPVSPVHLDSGCEDSNDGSVYYAQVTINNNVEKTGPAPRRKKVSDREIADLLRATCTSLQPSCSSLTSNRTGRVTRQSFRHSFVEAM